MTLFWFSLVGVVVLVVWAAWIEPRQLRVRRYRKTLAHLRHPLRIVVVADIQPNAYHWPADRLSATFKSIADREDPDVVLWLGDYFNAPTDKMKDFLDQNRRLRHWVDGHLPRMRDIADAMTCLRGRIATVAVLGNHDWAWSGLRTEQRLTEFGITVLKDDLLVCRDERTGQDICLIGYEDISSGRYPDFDGIHGAIPPEMPTIALSHSPDAFPLIEDGPRMVISGHTHGGQVRIPFVGPILLPVEFRKYDRGWFEENGRTLFVSSGLGTSLPPVRFLCPPEIVVIEFLPEEEE